MEKSGKACCLPSIFFSSKFPLNIWCFLPISSTEYITEESSAVGKSCEKSFQQKHTVSFLPITERFISTTLLIAVAQWSQAFVYKSHLVFWKLLPRHFCKLTFGVLLQVEAQAWPRLFFTSVWEERSLPSCGNAKGVYAEIVRDKWKWVVIIPTLLGDVKATAECMRIRNTGTASGKSQLWGLCLFPEKWKGDNIGSPQAIPRYVLLAGQFPSSQHENANQWHEYRKRETEIYTVSTFTRNPAESGWEPLVWVVSTHRLGGLPEIKQQFKNQ